MISPATPQQLAALAGLEQELFGPDAWTGPALHEVAAGPGRRSWTSQDAAGAVVGYVLTGLVGDFVELLRIGVRPADRRHGHARALLEVALAQALADGAERMLLEVSAGNGAALAFYERLGFAPIDRRPGYYRDGSDALVLELPLEVDQAPSGRMTP